IRGFRIEPGEIESLLVQHARVSDAMVVVQGEGGDKHLVAYVVSAGVNDEAALHAELRRMLEGRLPHYMCPTAYVVLERWPLTKNGKVDKRQLPTPKLPVTKYIAPQTATEIQLAKIWAHVLKHEAIGLNANFFELGGHSLLATQLLARIDEAFAIALPLRELFAAPTLERLAARIDRERDQLQPNDLEALLQSLEHLSDEEASAHWLAATTRSGEPLMK
ncbi:MAG TPA: phosphopantetheine-binding protein, partial [Lysobacter sp.]|nr:phosphopantetheine-binding protein [Lysobacter sp.]